MHSKLLFTLPAEPVIEEHYDITTNERALSVVTGYEVWLSSHESYTAHVASAHITPCGPYVVVTKKYRALKAEEVTLKSPE